MWMILSRQKPSKMIDDTKYFADKHEDDTWSLECPAPKLVNFDKDCTNRSEFKKASIVEIKDGIFYVDGEVFGEVLSFDQDTQEFIVKRISENERLNNQEVAISISFSYTFCSVKI